MAAEFTTRSGANQGIGHCFAVGKPRIWPNQPKMTIHLNIPTTIKGLFGLGFSSIQLMQFADLVIASSATSQHPNNFELDRPIESR
jgi:hypothetical protein